MKKFTSSFTACAALMLLGIGVTPPANAAYTFTDLGTLGGTYSSAAAINNAGQVVGRATTGDGSYHATVWNGTTATDLGTLGGNYGLALAINDAGQVAGSSSTTMSNTIIHATLWNGGTITDLGTLGWDDGNARAINNAGQVAGRAFTIGGENRATLWNGGTITDLGTLGGRQSEANAINNVGQVAGFSSTTGDAANHATVWNGTTATDLGTLGGNYSVARAINDASQVVGWSYTVDNGTPHATLWNGGTITDLGTLGGRESGALAINNSDQVAGWADTTCDIAHRIAFAYCTHATLWNGATATDLNSLLDAGTINAGWELTWATGINDNGWIVGDAYNRFTNQWHGYLLSDTATAAPITAVPEPETYAMLLAGLGLVGFTARRRKDHTA